MNAKTDVSDFDRRLINLAGKDFFTRDEAAFYACVSLSQFEEHAPLHGILAFRFMGKKVYRRSDIQNAMERAAMAAKALSQRPTPSRQRPGYDWSRSPRKPQK